METQVCFRGGVAFSSLKPAASSGLGVGGRAGQSHGRFFQKGARRVLRGMAVGQESGSLGHGLAGGPQETPSISVPQFPHHM